MTRPLADAIARRRNLPPAPKGVEDSRDAVIKLNAEKVRARGLDFAAKHTAEAKRLWDEAADIKDDVQDRSAKLRHRIQTTPASQLNQREIRKERDQLVRAGQRADQIEATARGCEEEAKRIKEDPIEHMEQLAERYPVLGNGGLAWPW